LNFINRQTEQVTLQFFCFDNFIDFFMRRHLNKMFLFFIRLLSWTLCFFRFSSLFIQHFVCE
jgi:hypothetical protein